MLNNYVSYAFMAVFLEDLGSTIILQRYRLISVSLCVYTHIYKKFCRAHYFTLVDVGFGN